MDHQSHEPARFWYYYDFSPLQPGRYYCGDCFQLLPAIESGTVDMVLIDPPYYMGKDKAWDCFAGYGQSAKPEGCPPRKPLQ